MAMASSVLALLCLCNFRIGFAVLIPSQPHDATDKQSLAVISAASVGNLAEWSRLMEFVAKSDEQEEATPCSFSEVRYHTIVYDDAERDVFRARLGQIFNKYKSLDLVNNVVHIHTLRDVFLDSNHSAGGLEELSNIPLEQRDELTHNVKNMYGCMAYGTDVCFDTTSKPHAAKTVCRSASAHMKFETVFQKVSEERKLKFHLSTRGQRIWKLDTARALLEHHSSIMSLSVAGSVFDKPLDAQRYRAAFDRFSNGDVGEWNIKTKQLKPLMRSLGFNPTETELADMFNDVDRDGNGKMNFAEFLTLMARMTRSSDAEKEMQSAFEGLGLGDGKIKREALRHLLTNYGMKVEDDEIDDIFKDKAELDYSDISGELRSTN